MPFSAPYLPGGILEDWKYTENAGGSYNNDGEYVSGTPQEVTFKAAQFPFSNDEIKYDTSGTYTAESQKLYTYTALANGTKVKNSADETFTVQEQKGYYPHVNGLYIYIIRRVGTTVGG